MNQQSLLTAATATLSGLLMAACGGGGSDGAELAQAAPPSAMAASVQVEGCVLSSDWGGAKGAAVHVRAADGRTLGTVFTNAKGVFVATVPARTDIVLTTMVGGPGDIAFKTGSTSLSVGGCLFVDA